MKTTIILAIVAIVVASFIPIHQVSADSHPSLTPNFNAIHHACPATKSTPTTLPFSCALP